MEVGNRVRIARPNLGAFDPECWGPEGRKTQRLYFAKESVEEGAEGEVISTDDGVWFLVLLDGSKLVVPVAEDMVEVV